MDVAEMLLWHRMLVGAVGGILIVERPEIVKLKCKKNILK